MKRGISVGDSTPPIVKMIPANVSNLTPHSFTSNLNNIYFSRIRNFLKGLVDALTML